MLCTFLPCRIPKFLKTSPKNRHESPTQVHFCRVTFLTFFFATCERYLLLLFFDPPRKSFPFLRNTQHRTGRLSKMLYREFRYIPFRIQQIFGQRLNENLSAHLFLFSLLKLRAENIIFRVAKVLTTGKGLWHLFLVE